MGKWRTIKGFENYEVSRCGRVVSTRGGERREMTRFKNMFGYYSVKLSTSETKPTSKRMLVHRLVAQTFLPNPNNKPIVNHIDFDRLNNHVSNLEWVTAKENVYHALRAGRHSMPRRRVRCIDTGQVFESTCEAARALGVIQPNIHASIIGKEGRTNANGYRFEYLED